MNQVQIILEQENNQGNVRILYNGRPVPAVFAIDMKFNSRTGELSLGGQRFKTDSRGQYYVDEQTKDTAMEDVNLLNLFNPHIMNREWVAEQQKALEFGLWNVYQTSMMNAENMIRERNCELRKAG